MLRQLVQELGAVHAEDPHPVEDGPPPVVEFIPLLADHRGLGVVLVPLHHEAFVLDFRLGKLPRGLAPDHGPPPSAARRTGRRDL
jgi:hypothetical protein